MQGRDVETVTDVNDPRPGRAGGVLQEIGPRRVETGSVVEPAQHCLVFMGHRPTIAGPAQHVAAGNGDVICDLDHDRHPGYGLVDRSVRVGICRDHGAESAW